MTTNYKNECISPWHLYLRMRNADSSHGPFPEIVYSWHISWRECLNNAEKTILFCYPLIFPPPPSHWHSSLTRFSLSFFPFPNSFSVCMWVDTSADANTNEGGGPRLAFFLDHSILIFQNEIMIYLNWLLSKPQGTFPSIFEELELQDCVITLDFTSVVSTYWLSHHLRSLVDIHRKVSVIFVFLSQVNFT